MESRLRWTGHVARMESDRLPTKFLDLEMDGRRERRRPSMRWIDRVTKDLKTVEVTGEDGMEFAEDIQEWRNISVTAAVAVQ